MFSWRTAFNFSITAIYGVEIRSWNYRMRQEKNYNFPGAHSKAFATRIQKVARSRPCDRWSGQRTQPITFPPHQSNREWCDFKHFKMAGIHYCNTYFVTSIHMYITHFITFIHFQISTPFSMISAQEIPVPIYHTILLQIPYQAMKISLHSTWQMNYQSSNKTTIQVCRNCQSYQPSSHNLFKMLEMSNNCGS